MLAWHELHVLLRSAADLAQVFVRKLVLVYHLAAHYQRSLRFVVHQVLDVLARAVDMLVELFALPLVLRLLSSDQYFQLLEHLVVSADECLLALGGRLFELGPDCFSEFDEDVQALLVESIDLFEELRQSLVSLSCVGVHFLGLFGFLLLLHDAHVEVDQDANYWCEELLESRRVQVHLF